TSAAQTPTSRAHVPTAQSLSLSHRFAVPTVSVCVGGAIFVHAAVHNHNTARNQSPTRLRRVTLKRTRRALTAATSNIVTLPLGAGNRLVAWMFQHHASTATTSPALPALRL